MSKRSTWWTMAAMAAMLAGAPAVMAQATGAPKDEAAQPQSPRRIKAVRKSVVDLEAMAKERRPGQVMPGDPSPVVRAPGGAGEPGPSAMTGGMEASTLPAELLPTKGTPIQLPDTAPDTRTIVKPEADPSGRAMSVEPIVRPGSAQGVAGPAPARDEVRAAGTPGAGVTDLTATPRIVTGHAEPLPPMDGGVVDVAPEKAGEPETGVALVDGAIVPNIPMALSTGAPKVRVESVKGDSSGVQWRVPGGAWSTLGAGNTSESRMEIRAGLDSDVVLVVDERVRVMVARLGRVLIERSTEVGGTTAVSVTVSRGAVEIRPMADAGFTAGEMFARVRTPDQMFGVTGALRVEYDAFTGTRRRTVNP